MTLFQKLAAEAFAAEKKATDACENHVKSCWICRWTIVHFFVRCLTAQGLLFDHMTSKMNADAYRLGQSLQRDENIPEAVVVENPWETPTADWLEKLYKL